MPLLSKALLTRLRAHTHAGGASARYCDRHLNASQLTSVTLHLPGNGHISRAAMLDHRFLFFSEVQSRECNTVSVRLMVSQFAWKRGAARCVNAEFLPEGENEHNE